MSKEQRREAEEVLKLLEEIERRKKYNRLAYVFPKEGPFNRTQYPHAWAFFKAGATYKDRLVVAANRVGKTFMGGCEMAMHLTGKYIDGWEGKRFYEPIKAWAAGVTIPTTTESIQDLLFGPLSDLGSGLIPKDDIIQVVRRSGGGESIQTAYIKHYTHGVNDGLSRLDLKAYEMGAEKFQAVSVHVIWLDEEPNTKDAVKIKEECITRTLSTATFPGGLIFMTFTPLHGYSKIVESFLPDGKVPIGNVHPEKGNWSIQITWEDIPHLDAEEKEYLLGIYQPWQREARSKGIIGAAEGVVYPVAESEYAVEPFTIPMHWPRVYALDVGYNWTAALWFAQDPSTHVWFAYWEHLGQQAVPAVNAHAIRTQGHWIPGVVDPAAGRKRDDGTTLVAEYRDLGLHLYLADNTLEAGIAKVWQMLQCNQLKVFASCTRLIKEIYKYHRDEEGKIPDGQEDHFCDALRYGVMSGLRLAQVYVDPDDEDDKRNFDNDGRDSITGY